MGFMSSFHLIRLSFSEADMKFAVAVCFAVSLGVAYGGFYAPALVRTPSLDTAIVHSHQVGGNFAYSTVEGHAYTALAPVVHSVVAPIQVAHIPFIQHQVIAAQPIVSAPGVIAQAPVASAPVVAAPAPISSPAQSPSSVAIDEDTVAIESA